MNGLGRFLAMQAMSGETGRRDTQDEWRALHRRPDAPPVPDEEIGIAHDRASRRREAFTLRRLMTRFGHR